MPVKMELNAGAKNSHKPVKIYTRDVEQTALSQLKNLSQLPFIHSHIAAMPDVHAGIGATVGSVIPTKAAIIPAAVGVDIGCGMVAAKLTIKASQLPDNLRRIRDEIERAVPVGARAHKMISARTSACRFLEPGIQRLFEKHPTLLKMLKQPQQTWVKQLGTLGSGNHFIELCFDESDDVWLMLHSGSRGIGNAIGRYFIQLAKKDLQRNWQNIPDRDLAYFTEGSQHFDDYWEAVAWAQEYARINREEMFNLVLRAIRPLLPDFTLESKAINCHHNYVSLEQHYGEQVYVTRKGAIRAGNGDLGIIPGSMGARSYIVRGKGQEESFCSCAHGAGRQMSRTEARRRFKREDLLAQTQGVECRKDKGVLDEIPGAYKDIDVVMENQSDLVEVLYTLKQVLCIKG
ncbi:RtcB family protein [Pseudoteredinibacter isoporae]|uniref:3'-phosphate/5'-hydroxy nucleic acid ligase n=1 Tax=Pseudoteredinibacter isoporae TaxID=570281 RepID=A0A7X0JU19_9GAMM|nr:RtcB family protein [Pseudoteredinibacter isoporae]MBB6521834.1 tRNA-splicing ligase RtcB [Pseudoteredinibacter isoporae]NHO87378.1 RtcB family protein [Pseudoteredinibacter isoporae]NIB23202.1 RtcB family protein [Pseudoteredinibacter isoporae]